MPIYEYECKLCDLTITITRSIKDTENTVICVECGGSLQRKYGWGATTFNGEGFYSQDMRMNNKNINIKE